MVRSSFLDSLRSTMVPVAKGERLDWLDVARGFCMILVVMMHFDELLFTKIVTFEPAGKIWDFATSAARPARIPTFFLISGFLAGPSLARKFSSVVSRRCLLQYYCFILWSFAFTLTLYMLFRHFDGQAVSDFFSAWLVNLVWPRSQIWFLYALALFFCVARVFRNKPFLAMSGAFVMFAFSEWATDDVTSQMLRSLLFYLAGAYFPVIVQRIAAATSLKLIAALTVLYAAGVGLILVGDKQFPLIWLPATVTGVSLLIQLAKLICGTKIGDVVQFIGRNTLPIYVMHGILLLSLAQAGFILHLFDMGGTGSKIFQAGFPIVGNILVIAACLVVHRLLLKAGFDWLFSPPTALSKAVEGMVRRFESRSADALSPSVSVKE